MSSFWNSQRRKAKKPHTCIYCGRVIQPGEKYSHESGVSEGEFQHYNLCTRCRWVINEFDSDGDYISDLLDTAFNNDFLRCPQCDSINNRAYEFAHDMMSCECECDDCDHHWEADLSIEGIKKITQSA
jgi:predicted RNA-binding Zn-ribbon protein involved in translation (DUF1610 family)